MLKKIKIIEDRKLKSIGIYYENTIHMSLDTLEELHSELLRIKKDARGEIINVYQSSLVEGVFNLGGDLRTFTEAIKKEKFELLEYYAHKCIDCLLLFNSLSESGMSTFSLIEGAALGGGFEAALAGQYIFVSKKAKISFPEAGFNLFPGMGAYSFLKRRTSNSKALQIIQHGENLSLEKLKEDYIIDLLVPEGETINIAKKIFKENLLKANTLKSIGDINALEKQHLKNELYQVVEIWLEGVRRLENRNLCLMEKLYSLQRKKESKLIRKPVLNQ